MLVHQELFPPLKFATTEIATESANGASGSTARNTAAAQQTNGASAAGRRSNPTQAVLSSRAAVPTTQVSEFVAGSSSSQSPDAFTRAQIDKKSKAAQTTTTGATASSSAAAATPLTQEAGGLNKKKKKQINRAKDNSSPITPLLNVAKSKKVHHPATGQTMMRKKKVNTTTANQDQARISRSVDVPSSEPTVTGPSTSAAPNINKQQVQTTSAPVINNYQ